MLFLSSETVGRCGILRILKNNGQNEGKRAQYECGTFGDLRRYCCGAAFSDHSSFFILRISLSGLHGMYKQRTDVERENVECTCMPYRQT